MGALGALSGAFLNQKCPLLIKQQYHTFPVWMFHSAKRPIQLWVSLERREKQAFFSLSPTPGD